MNKMKKIVSLLLSIMLIVTALSACSFLPGSDDETNKPALKIGFIQFSESASFDSVKEAFAARLTEWGYTEENISVDYKNAKGDAAAADAICEAFVTDEVDIIVAVSTPAAKSAIKSVGETEIKVVFCDVENPETELGITADSNVTGVVAAPSSTDIMSFALTVVPDIKTLGILYNSKEDTSKKSVEELKVFLKEKKIELVEGMAVNSEEAVKKTTELCATVDAIFVPNGDMISSAMEKITAAANNEKTPLFGSTYKMLEDGALGTVCVDYSEIGEKTCDIIVKLIEGAEIKDVPIFSLESFNPYINETTVAATFIKLPDEVIKTANFIK